MSEERESFAVTPSGCNPDSRVFRDFAECSARAQGFEDLRWNYELDRYGRPIARLTGVRKPVRSWPAGTIAGSPGEIVDIDTPEAGSK